MNDRFYESEEFRRGPPPEWKPIETAPNGATVLVGTWNVPWACAGKVNHYEDEAGKIETLVTLQHYNGVVFVCGFYATHWMPLPEPPSDN